MPTATAQVRVVRELLVAAWLAAVPMSVVSGQATADTTRGKGSHVLRGVIRDPSGQPIAFANIQAAGSTNRSVAATDGGFELRALSGGRTFFQIRRLGFAPGDFTLESVPDTAVSIVLQPTAQLLKGQLVSAELNRSLEKNGFYERLVESHKGVNYGYFVTPEDLDRRKPNYITQMAEGLPSIQVWRNPMNPRVGWLLGDNRDLRGNRCRMTVYVDGMRISGKLNGGDVSPDEMVAPNEVSGMEIYPRAVGAPPRYQPLNGTCGVALIWTR